MHILQPSQLLCGWKKKLIFLNLRILKFVLNFILIEHRAHMQSLVRQFLQGSFTNIIKGPFFIRTFLYVHF